MRRFLAAVALASLAGCGTPAKLDYFTLTAPALPPSAPAAPGPSVFVGPVTIPEAVDRPQMVRRVAANQVEIMDLERWAEPLKAAIPRVLADALARDLGTSTVMTSRQSAALAFDYRVAVDIERFDFSPGDGASVDALWTVRAGPDGAPRTGRSQARESAGSGGAQAMAAAQSRALEAVARDIAAAIREARRP
ncbi:MAG: PqiC family protein [Usitatibacter sp.]